MRNEEQQCKADEASWERCTTGCQAMGEGFPASATETRGGELRIAKKSYSGLRKQEPHVSEVRTNMELQEGSNVVGRDGQERCGQRSSERSDGGQFTLGPVARNFILFKMK